MRIHRWISAVGLSLVLAAAVIAAPASSAATKASCNSTFSVLHNDKSGGVTLPKGTYRVTSPNMSCILLGATFRTFLAKYNGKIPGWSVTPFGTGHGKYRQNSTGLNFTVQRLGLGATPPSKSSCKSTFSVLHNDKSGGVILPKGTYRVTSPNMSCTLVGATFKTFLAKYNGKIPGWSTTPFGKGHGKYRQNSTGLNFTVQLLKSKK